MGAGRAPTSAHAVGSLKFRLGTLVASELVQQRAAGVRGVDIKKSSLPAYFKYFVKPYDPALPFLAGLPAPLDIAVSCTPEAVLDPAPLLWGWFPKGLLNSIFGLRPPGPGQPGWSGGWHPAARLTPGHTVSHSRGGPCCGLRAPEL